MSKLHKEQQKRIDDIAKKYYNYLDEFYDPDDTDVKKKTENDRRRAKQDIGLPAVKPKKKPDYGTGKCIQPGCGVEFKKNSGVQRHCPKHRKPIKYIPVVERGNNGSKS